MTVMAERGGGWGCGPLGLHRRRLGATGAALFLPHHPAAEQAQREEADGQHDTAGRERVRHHAILGTPEREGSRRDNLVRDAT